MYQGSMGNPYNTNEYRNLSQRSLSVPHLSQSLPPIYQENNSVNNPPINVNNSDRLSPDIFKLHILEQKLHRLEQLRKTPRNNRYSSYNDINYLPSPPSYGYQMPINFLFTPPPSSVQLQYQHPLNSPLLSHYQRPTVRDSIRIARNNLGKIRGYNFLYNNNNISNDSSVYDEKEEDNKIRHELNRYYNKKNKLKKFNSIMSRKIRKIGNEETNKELAKIQNNDESNVSNVSSNDKENEFIFIEKNKIEEIVDEKIKSIEQKQQEDFENIKAAIAKGGSQKLKASLENILNGNDDIDLQQVEQDDIPQLLKEMPRLIDMKIQENEERKRIEKLKEEELINKIKNDLQNEFKPLLKEQKKKSKLQPINQITQLTPLIIEPKNKELLNIDSLVKEKMHEQVIREMVLRENNQKNDQFQNFLYQEQLLREQERQQMLMKDERIRQLEMREKLLNIEHQKIKEELQRKEEEAKKVEEKEEEKTKKEKDQKKVSKRKTKKKGRNNEEESELEKSKNIKTKKKKKKKKIEHKEADDDFDIGSEAENDDDDNKQIKRNRLKKAQELIENSEDENEVKSFKQNKKIKKLRINIDNESDETKKIKSNSKKKSKSKSKSKSKKKKEENIEEDNDESFEKPNKKRKKKKKL